MRFVGVDLGWKKDGDTALVALDFNANVVDYGYVNEDREIVSFVESHSWDGCLVGIDAPLIVKNFRGCRECERYLQSKGMSVLPANRGWFLRAFKTVRGEDLLAALNKAGFRLVDDLNLKEASLGIVEVYPYAALKMLFKDLPTYKKGRKSTRLAGLLELKELLEQLNPPLNIPSALLQIGREDKITLQEMKITVDYMDAAISAYTALKFYRNPDDCTILGSKEDGFILLPEKLL